MADAYSNAGVSNGSGTRPPERRRHARVRCNLPAEIRRAESPFTLQAETTDVSLGGCYVATTFPLPKDLTVDFRCWVAGTPIACKAVVRTADPGVGNGIEFLDLDELSRAILSVYLDSLREEGALAQESIIVIRPHI